MVISEEKLESLLVDAVESRHDHQFRYILETLKVNPDDTQKCFNGLSLFEKVLSTPRSQIFIDLCIQSGSDFYKKNSKNVYPINYAVQSLCADNLRAILKFPDRDDVVDIRYSKIINEKSEGGNNYLHYLVDRLNGEENFAEVSELIQIIVRNGCSTNSPNNRLESPFYLLLRKLRKVSCDNSLIEFVLDNSDVDLFSYRSNEVSDMMNERGLSHRCAVKDEAVRDGDFMIRILEDWNEQKFIDEFENYRLYAPQTSCDYKNDLSRLMEAATVRNLTQAVHLLLLNGARVNGMAKESNFMPAFLACTFGNPEVLKRLLGESSLSMQCLINNRSLLHQICMSSNIHEIQRQQCFDLIISDVRCSLTVINSLDGVGQTPLFWACHFGFDEIAKELLRRGAYIGHDSVINNIDKDVLGEFLDECIKSSTDIKDKKCEIHVDFRFLLPPNAIEGSVHQEVLPIHKITDNDRLKELILHPVISTFLYLKWRKVNWIIYLNLLVYFTFMIFLGSFIILFFNNENYSLNKQCNATANLTQENTPVEAKATPALSSVIIGGRERILPAFEDTVFPGPPPAGAFSSVGFAGGAGFASNGFDAPNIPEVNGNALDKTDKNGLNFGPPSTEKPAELIDEAKPNLFALIFGFEPKGEKRTKRSTDQATRRTAKSKNKALNEFINKNLFAYRICVFGFFLMLLYEVVQCFCSYRNYFFKLSNWLDMALIGLSFVVLFHNLNFCEYLKKINAALILVMAAQTIQLVAKVSIMSMSLHMAIFKRVCLTFLKTISLYLVLIIAFAMSFYTLNDKKGMQEATNSTNAALKAEDPTKPKEEEDKSFSNPFISIITTVRMMLSDFDKIEIKNEDVFEGIIFLLFVTLITVVLFNLLNALAISNTTEILKDAELVDTEKRISILNSYEKVFVCFNQDFANILPRMTSIMFTPNKDNVIKVRRAFTSPLDVKIVMHKTGKTQTFVKVPTLKYKFWKKGTEVVTLGNKVFAKVVNFVKTQQGSK